jgi:hypothetical protein
LKNINNSTFYYLDGIPTFRDVTFRDRVFGIFSPPLASMTALILLGMDSINL